MNQEERIICLIEELKKDTSYKDIRPSNDPEENRDILRSLMNVRMPKDLDEKILKIQDDYLKDRNAELGIVSLDEINTIKEDGYDNKYADVLSLWQGDITRLKVDAIVNAANSSMLGCFVPLHKCIDNCIHTYAGIQLRNECNRKMNEFKKIYSPSYEQPTSIPLLTDAYNLPCRKIIHVVGPIVSGILNDSLREDLKNCYVNCLNMCKENSLRSIAFCCISTGVYAFPADEACSIAVDSVCRWLDENDGAMDRVIFNVFSLKDRKLYEHKLNQLSEDRDNYLEEETDI